MCHQEKRKKKVFTVPSRSSFRNKFSAFFRSKFLFVFFLQAHVKYWATLAIMLDIPPDGEMSMSQKALWQK